MFGKSTGSRLCLVVLLLVPLVRNAEACGDIRYWIDAYFDGRSTDMTRQRAIEMITEICVGYEAVKTDQVLLHIATDAIDRAYPKYLIQGLFERYRCFLDAVHEPEYSRVATILDQSGCPAPSETSRWRIVDVRSAILRSAPSKAANIVTQLAFGTVVEELDTSGDWLAVTTWAGEKGYLHSSLVVDFPNE